MENTVSRAAVEAAVTRKVNEFGTKGLKTYRGAWARIGHEFDTKVDWMVVLNAKQLFVPVVILKPEELYLAMSFVHRGCFVTSLGSL